MEYKEKDDIKKITATDVINRYEKLKSARLNKDQVFQECCDLIFYNRGNILRTTTNIRDKNRNIYDWTAYQSALKLASGQLTYICPQTSVWFGFEPQDKTDPNNAHYFNACAEIARSELAKSNFYLQMHEVLLDRCMGICCLFVDYKKDKLTFKAVAPGTYVIQENEEGIVDTVIREFEVTTRVARNMFINDNDFQEKTEILDKDMKMKFLHYVCPNENFDETKLQTKNNKKYHSVYVSRITGKVVKDDDGYNEMPYIVSRFLHDVIDQYGIGPALEMLPIIRQVNQIEKDLDILGEKLANPPILISDKDAYDIDARAGGITRFDASRPDSKPTEWLTSGKYDVGMDRLKEKREFIKQAFYVPLFETIASYEGTQPRTATEIMALENEKLVSFSPTFARLTVELLNPLLERIFGLLIRNNKFPSVPPSMYNGEFKITYKSKFSLALENINTGNFMQYMQVGAQLAQINPSVIDIIDTDKAAAYVASAYNVPVEVMRSPAEIDQIRKQRAADQQAQQQQALQQEILKNADKVGKLQNLAGNM